MEDFSTYLAPENLEYIPEICYFQALSKASDSIFSPTNLILILVSFNR